MIWIYRLAIFPFLFAGFHLAALFNAKIRLGLALRYRNVRGRAGRLRALRGAVWIHASSGEFEYAKPVVTLLKTKFPHVPVVVTYFSPTYAAAIAKYPGVDFSLPVPWDTPLDLARFVRDLAPRALLIARTDLWPEMLVQARAVTERILFSATLSETAQKVEPGLRRLLSGWLLDQLTRIAVVSNDDADAFKTLTRTPVDVLGDTRFDQVMARLAHPKPVREDVAPAERVRTVVCGSTWSEDEDTLIPLIKTLRSMTWIIAPHEPTRAHLETLTKKLRQHALTWSFYSHASEPPLTGSVLIIDSVGVLAEIYQWGAFAFVGGSFRGSVHSVMEPLAAGCLTLVGPHHTNNREALIMKTIAVEPLVASTARPYRIVHAFQNGEAARDYLIRAAEAMTHDEDLEEEVLVHIQDQILARAGTSEALVNQLQRSWEKPT